MDRRFGIHAVDEGNVVDAIADRLLDVRESYAATLDDDNADAYRRAFASGAARRFRRYASLVADLEEPEG